MESAKPQVYDCVRQAGQITALRCATCAHTIERGAMAPGERGALRVRRMQRWNRMLQAMREHLRMAHGITLGTAPKPSLPKPVYKQDYGRGEDGAFACFHCSDFYIDPDAVDGRTRSGEVSALAVFERQRSRMLAHFKIAHTEEFS